MYGDNAPIEQLDLPVAVCNALRRARIHTVGDIRRCSVGDLLGIRGLDISQVEAILRRLRNTPGERGEEEPRGPRGPRPGDATGFGGGGAGDREPRRPKPFSGTGASVVPMPTKRKLADAITRLKTLQTQKTDEPVRRSGT